MNSQVPHEDQTPLYVRFALPMGNDSGTTDTHDENNGLYRRGAPCWRPVLGWGDPL